MPTKQPILTLDPIREMDHLRGVISQESISNEGIVHALTNLIPSLQKNFQNFVHGFTRHEPAIDLKSNELEFLKLLDKQVYLNLSPLVAYVPEGLQVSYVEYLDVLKDIALHCSETTLQCLNDYSMFLAQIITNRHLKYSVAPFEAKYAKMEKTRKDLIARMNKCFKIGSSKAESNYGDVVSRNAEWKEVFTTLQATSTLINKISREDLHKKAEECNRQLEIIIKQIRNNEFEGAGPEVTNNLSNGAFQSGAELELFTVAFFRLTTVNTAISDTVNNVAKILKEQQK